ncbi:hypothetical protein BG011_004617 [Mortierella polycephala]|uniref:NAD(P)-binding domain-containing protein n=1 Tax=Mortierella polycephala TaxID=41804 RepID=A0A9P6Q166_9FUNG|nr:hypothetical protein BG011_004617 [Mortierella polycephala]
MASETKKSRDTIYISSEYPYLQQFPTSSSTVPSVPPIPPVTSSFKQHPTPSRELLFTDLEHFQRSLPSTTDQKKEAKIAQRERREQIVQRLQQQQIEAQEKAKQEKLEKQQAKQERKQRRSEYKQMYQAQYDHIANHSKDKHQQLSLPIHPHSSSVDPLSPDVQFHNCHQYPLDSRESLSSSSSSTGSRSSRCTPDRIRSLSLKSTTKSMYDLRPSRAQEYRSGYESDENSFSKSSGWDSLMDTLNSPTLTSPSDAHSWDAKDENEFDLMGSMSGLTLSGDNNGNGNGKYLLSANGRTGIELVKQGLERNYRVTAFVRDDKLLLEDSALRKNQNLLIVRGSPTSQADVDSCVEGQDVVVNVIGARLMASDATIGSHSQVVLNNAMKKHGVRRLIVITSYGCLGLRNYLINTRKLFSRVFMTGILKDKVLQEDIVQRDTEFLDWTIIRPITLKDGDMSERYWVSCEELPKTNKVKLLTRKDLAHYILTIINRPQDYKGIRSIAGRPKSSKGSTVCPMEKKHEQDRQH